MKRVTILRGIPGAGKTTYWKTHFPEATVVSADEFFTRPDGEFAYDAAKIAEAHGTCFRAFVAAAERGDPHIVVDNTAIEVWEVAPYVVAAAAFGYEVEILTIRCTPDIAAARSVHHAPAGYVAARARRLRQVKLPRRWKHTVIDWDA